MHHYKEQYEEQIVALVLYSCNSRLGECLQAKYARLFSMKPNLLMIAAFLLKARDVQSSYFRLLDSVLSLFQQLNVQCRNQSITDIAQACEARVLSILPLQRYSEWQGAVEHGALETNCTPNRLYGETFALWAMSSPHQWSGGPCPYFGNTEPRGLPISILTENPQGVLLI